MYMLVSFLYIYIYIYIYIQEHDFIKIGPKLKANVLCVVQSTLSVYNIQPLIARCMNNQ